MAHESCHNANTADEHCKPLRAQRLGQTSLYMIEGKKLFICVVVYLASKYELVTLFLCLQLETGQVFYVFIDRTTRKPCPFAGQRQYLHFSVFQEFSRRLGCTPALLGYLWVLMSCKTLFFYAVRINPAVCEFAIIRYLAKRESNVNRKWFPPVDKQGTG